MDEQILALQNELNSLKDVIKLLSDDLIKAQNTINECVKLDNALMDYEAKSKNYILPAGTYHGRTI